MAYGDYQHPQVIILRQFRDDFLDKTILGKWFTKTYYNYSPLLVEKLKNKKVVNSLIRKTLNQFIKLLKK
jgi:predicted amino acid dehydrogenase